MSEQAVRQYADGRRFSAPTTERWLRSDARDALLGIAEGLRLGENQLRDLLDAIEDIAARRGCAAGAVLQLEPVSAVLRGKLGRNDQVKALKAALRRLRYPQLTATEERLRQLARRLELPAAARLELPADLEGSEVTLILRAGSAAALCELLDAAAAAARRPELDEMFRVLGGES